MSLLRARRSQLAAAFYGNTVNAYLTCGDVATTDVAPATAFSLVCWFKLIPLASLGVGSCALVCKENTAVTAGYVFWVLAGGNLYFRIKGSGGSGYQITTVEGGFDDGEWHCAVVTKTTSTGLAGVTMYLDGVALTQGTVVGTTVSGTVANAYPFQIGARESNGNPVGYLRNAMFFNYALSGADAVALYGRGVITDPRSITLSGVAPLHYLKLAGDYTDRGSAATAVPVPTNYGVRERFRRAVTPDGEQGSYLRLNGTTQYGAMAHDASLTFAAATPYTIVTWTRRATSTADGYVIAKLDLGVNGWGLYVSTTGVIRHNQTSSGAAYRQIETAAGALPFDSEFHLVVSSYDGSNVPAGFAFSVDTIPKANVTLSNVGTGTNYGGTYDIAIGARTLPLALWYNGDIAWVAVYSGVLTAAQVTSIFAAGPWAPPPTGSRLLTARFADPAETATVVSFPSDVTLTNGPVYGAETYPKVARVINGPWSPASVGSVAEWSLEGSLDDDIGALDLTSTDATSSYTTWPNGRRMLNCSTSRAFTRTTHDASLTLLGNMTAMCLVYPTSVDVGTYGSILLAFGGDNTEGEADNSIWWLSLESTGVLAYYVEGVAGADITYRSAAGLVTFGELSHVGMTRTSNVIRFYVNGSLVSTSGTLSAPTNGSNGKLGVGGSSIVASSARRLVGQLGDVQVVGSALSDAQMLAAANKSRLNLS